MWYWVWCELEMSEENCLWHTKFQQRLPGAVDGADAKFWIRDVEQHNGQSHEGGVRTFS